jgi:hypothetical protein
MNLGFHSFRAILLSMTNTQPLSILTQADRSSVATTASYKIQSARRKMAKLGGFSSEHKEARGELQSPLPQTPDPMNTSVLTLRAKEKPKSWLSSLFNCFSCLQPTPSPNVFPLTKNEPVDPIVFLWLNIDSRTLFVNHSLPYRVNLI